MWRMHYFVDVCRLLQFATVLRLRCGDRMAPRQAARARALPARRPLAARAGAAVAARRARAAAAGAETLGAEWMLAYAFAWRRLLAATRRASARSARLRLDALPPPALDPAPGRAARPTSPAARAIAEKIAPLRLGGRATTRRARINLLIPTIDLEHFFGGYIAQVQPRAAARRARRCGCGS